jgi:hypothetical protein
MARNPTCLSDSVEMYVQHQDSASSIIAVSATATASLLSSDITNTVQKGAAFYVTISSISVSTVTCALNISGKNAATDTYFPVARVSIDGIATSGRHTGIIYPGIGTSGLPTGANAANGILPAVYQVQASLTVTTTATATASLALSGVYSVQIGMCKIL